MVLMVLGVVRTPTAQADVVLPDQCTAFAVSDPGTTTGTAYQALTTWGDNRAWVAGYSYAEDPGNPQAAPALRRWDGREWRDVPGRPAGLRGAVEHLSAAGPDDIWTSGYGYDESGQAIPQVVRVTGRTWVVQEMPTGLTRPGPVFAASPHDVWAAASTTTPDGQNWPALVHWTHGEWSPVALPLKVNGQSDPFGRTDPVVKEFTAVVRNFPDLHRGENAAGDRVAITVADNAPKADYAKTCAQTKASWGTMGGQVERNAVLNLSTRIAPRQATRGAELTAVHGTEEYREELFAMLSRPGPALVAMSPREAGIGHVAALYVTDTEFWLFDSLVGELVLPLANLRTWFDTDKVREYFDKRSYVSASALVLT